MNEVPSIYWFRSDLRLTDLPGLSAASAAGPVLACYVYDELSDDAWTPGSASRWWLRRSLSALSNELEKRGGNLLFMQGRPETVLAKLACEVGADTVFCSREYEPCSDDIERRVAESLTENGRRLKRYGGTLLWEPEQVRTRTDTPFKVFTPFWKCCLTLPEPGLAAGGPLRFVQGQSASSASLKSFDLDCADDTGARWAEYWSPGSIGAKKSLKDFEESALDGYGEGRDFPERAATSLLSPHLRFGEISPHRVYHSIKEAARRRPDLQSEADDYLRELGWREFSRHLLYHHPSLPEQPFRSEFARFPWCGAQESLVAWQEGKTGYPIVDAGMRELKQTGYMHNRVRMITASFLCKHLLIDWRAGQRWFWNHLMDADLAANAFNWQWVAGSGTDASPYFRIFSPMAQGVKFDKAGAYVKEWVPELSALEPRYVHSPWEAPTSVLDGAGICLGDNYPLPLVDHVTARKTALAAYDEVRAA